jgi:hypothetical protein
LFFSFGLSSGLFGVIPHDLTSTPMRPRNTTPTVAALSDSLKWREETLILFYQNRRAISASWPPRADRLTFREIVHHLEASGVPPSCAEKLSRRQASNSLSGSFEWLNSQDQGSAEIKSNCALSAQIRNSQCRRAQLK